MISQQVITGRGIDNHLLGIRNIASETGIQLPKCLADSNFKNFNHFELSTSQIPTGNSSIYMCYGPVVPNGYGVSYNPQKVNCKKTSRALTPTLASSQFFLTYIFRMKLFFVFRLLTIVTRLARGVSSKL